jgi:hypothetical protein
MIFCHAAQFLRFPQSEKQLKDDRQIFARLRKPDNEPVIGPAPFL